jgi:oxygen-independent coproporphyrinogen-3 oxidase
VPVPPPTLGLYLHIPFCRVKCPYCSFVVYVRREHVRERYLAALVAEMRLRDAAALPEELGIPRDADGRLPVGTVYLGGGTPSLLTPAQLGALLAAARETFAVRPDAEITVETEPGTTDRETFAALVALGVNRVTIGVQSFQPHHLARLGRAHGPEDARMAIRAARNAGVRSVDLDLMFGLPDQTVAEWERDLDEALAHSPDHLSLYNLTVEPGTPFSQAAGRGALPLPEEDAQAAMMRIAMARCAERGLPQYEISNFARPGHASRHNAGYWSGAPYLGLGVGAHGYLPRGGAHGLGHRWWNVRVPERYVQQIGDGALPVQEGEDLDRPAALLEALFLGLRQRRGIDRAAFASRFGVDVFDAGGATARQLVHAGCLSVEARWVKLTEDGVIIADYVIGKLARSLDTPEGSDTVTHW